MTDTPSPIQRLVDAVEAYASCPLFSRTPSGTALVEAFNEYRLYRDGCAPGEVPGGVRFVFAAIYPNDSKQRQGRCTLVDMGGGERAWLPEGSSCLRYFLPNDRIRPITFPTTGE